MDISPSSKPIPKFKSNILNMDTSGERSSKRSNSNRSRGSNYGKFNAEQQARHDKEIRLIAEKRQRALRIREEKKMIQEAERTGHPTPTTDIELRTEAR
jgi:hypothetical protein